MSDNDMNKKLNAVNANYLYSVGIAGFARLNTDGSLPTPTSWTFKSAKGESFAHVGGLLGRTDALDAKILNDASRNKIYLTYGTKRCVTDFKMSSSSSSYSISNVVDSLNATLQKAEVTNAGISLRAEVKNIQDKPYLRIYDSTNKLPYYAPIGVVGYIPSYLGLGSYIVSEDVKSIKTDFEKESGKSVDITSGRGIRCVVKETDKIKGINLTINSAAVDRKILSLITGQTYDMTEDSFFVDTSIKAPSFAFTCFIKAFLQGENNESSFEKIKFVCYPCCQTTLPGESLTEGAFSTMELQAFCSKNNADNLPIMFYRDIPLDDYRKFIEA